MDNKQPAQSIQEQLDAAMLIPDGPEKEELLKMLNKEKAAEEKRLQDEQNKKAQEAFDRRVKAVIETVLAYYRRGEMQQYDSVALVDAGTRDGAIGTRRATDHVSPEDATFDSVSYFVCSTFAYNVYYEAIGFKLCGTADNVRCCSQYKIGDASVVYHWIQNCGETLHDAIKTLRPLLRPGDILTSSKSTAHCMVFLGDYKGDGIEYISHSWGGKYSMITGKEAHEKKGTVRIQPVDELCFCDGNKEWYKENKVPRWSMYDNMKEIIVLRPLRIATDENYPLTANAKARLAHPGLNITRTATPGAYRNVPIGGTITYKLTVENHSDSDYTNLPIVEKIPDGVSLVSDGNGTLKENTLSWNVDIPAGGSVFITYQVKVTTNALEAIVSEGGHVAGIRSNRMITLVGNVLESSGEEKLEALIDQEINVTIDSEDAFALPRYLYGQILGKDLPVPSAKEFIRAAVTETTGLGANGRLVRRTPNGCAYDCCIVPRYQGGMKLVTGTEKDRILEFSLRYLQPGDIILYVNDLLENNQTEVTYTYLGKDAFAYVENGKAVITHEDILWQAFQKDLFFCIRPSMAKHV